MNRADDSSDPQEDAKEEHSGKTKKQRPEVKSIYLVPYPKIIFLYPTFLVSLVAAIWMTILGHESVSPENFIAVALCGVFLLVLALNLVVLAFDFPRATSLTLVFVIMVLVLGGVLGIMLYPQIVPSLTSAIKSLRPVANATFYWGITATLGFILLAVRIVVQFEYWEVRPNELLHHHGILSDLKRYSAPNLRIDKEINDVFEYVLLRSGRLILQPSGERRAIILDNIPFIDSKEQAITQMLGALQVKVQSRD